MKKVVMIFAIAVVLLMCVACPSGKRGAQPLEVNVSDSCMVILNDSLNLEMIEKVEMGIDSIAK